MKVKLTQLIKDTLKVDSVQLETPENPAFGDYTTNIALQLFSKKDKSEQLNKSPINESTNVKSPRDLAADLVDNLKANKDLMELVEKIDVAGAGFINFFLSKQTLTDSLSAVLEKKEFYGSVQTMKGRKIMVEFAHPNTHKELHIGHMRTLITGEAISRILQAAGVEVFRANYQGDVGPHVAKAIWGTRILLEERKLSWEDAEKLSATDKAHLLGEGYVLGNQRYEEKKQEIDSLNKAIYEKYPEVWGDYQRTRKWSLDYYDKFYERFSTKFNRLFFESEVAEDAVKTVKENIGKVFEESQGAVVFPGEKYDLHTRVFITAAGTPTYEGKEMALACKQFEEFPFDTNIHVVANEQSGYFKVVIKALELIDAKFTGREYHLPMGMVNLIGRKMSSRTGEILRVDQLLDEIKEAVRPLMKNENLPDVESIIEQVTMAAIKYSFLKVGPKADVAFDIKQSVNLEGDSGPYIQYTYARTHSVLEKSPTTNNQQLTTKLVPSALSLVPNPDERLILSHLSKFSEVVEEAAKTYSPNLIAGYLYELAQRYNAFYNKYRITNPEGGPDEAEKLKSFRLALTEATGQVLKNGLNLLGIQSPERM